MVEVQCRIQEGFSLGVDKHSRSIFPFPVQVLSLELSFKFEAKSVQKSAQVIYCVESEGLRDDDLCLMFVYVEHKQCNLILMYHSALCLLVTLIINHISYLLMRRITQDLLATVESQHPGLAEPIFI